MAEAEFLPQTHSTKTSASPRLRLPKLRELRQLRELIAGDSALQFDVVLTNPPFSMKKEAKEDDQRQILEEYESAYVMRKGIRKLRGSLRSNVMFLERYHELLKPGGRLVTVIDESVLNTSSDADHRERLFRHFYIRAVFSLPQDAFSDAGANVKTSILVLDRKEQESEDQPDTFYGRSENIGYRASRINEAISDLSGLLAAFREFEATGSPPTQTKAHWTERSRFFKTRLTDPAGRIDFEWNDPRHEDMDSRLQQLVNARGYAVLTLGGSSGLCDLVTGKGADEYVSEGVPILKVRNVTGEGISWESDFVLKAFFDSNSTTHLKRGDVLVTTTGLGTIGRVDLLDVENDCMTDGHVTTLRLKTPPKVSPDFLVHYLRSPLGQMQMERFTVGCTGQTELNDPDLAKVCVANY